MSLERVDFYKMLEQDDQFKEYAEKCSLEVLYKTGGEPMLAMIYSFYQSGAGTEVVGQFLSTFSTIDNKED